jgi:hypothetical protein
MEWHLGGEAYSRLKAVENHILHARAEDEKAVRFAVLP